MAKKRKKPKPPKAVSTPKVVDVDAELFPDIAHPKQRMFLGALCEHGNIERAAELATICRRTHYNWLIGDAKYAAAFAKAQKLAATLLEDEARRRAVDGVRRLKFHEGKVITIEVPDPKPDDPENTKEVPYVEHEFSDGLLMFLLKANAPDKFRDRVDLEGGLGVVNILIIPPPGAKGKLSIPSMAALPAGR